MKTDSITLNIPPEKFQRELRELTVSGWRWVADAELFLSMIGGQREPFLGDVYSHSFKVRRNWRVLWCSYYITGNYHEKDGKTEIAYNLAPDSFWFYLIRVNGMIPPILMSWAFVTSADFSAPSVGVALIVPIAAYFLINGYDRMLGKRLGRIFIEETSIMQYADKSRFAR